MGSVVAWEKGKWVSSKTTWRETRTRFCAIEAAVSLVLGGIAEEDTSCRARGKFVRGSGYDVRVAETPKHAQRCIVRVSAVEEEEEGVVVASAARATIEEECGRVKSFGPVRERHGCVREERANSVI